MYEGDLPWYFPYFLESCRHNRTVNWTIVSSYRPSELPDNVSWESFDRDDFKRRFRNKFGFSPVLETSYKLADYKPCWGYLYSELVEGYDFWGHCDADVVWGNLREYYTTEVLQAYEKVGARGAFSLYRNDRDESNCLMRLVHPEINWKRVFREPKYCGFDEWHGICRLLQHHSMAFWNDNKMAEIACGPSNYRLRYHPNYRTQAFFWKDGKVVQVSRGVNGIRVSDFSYIHLQKRSLLRNDLCRSGAFAITPTGMRMLDDADFVGLDLTEFNPVRIGAYLEQLTRRIKQRMTRHRRVNLTLYRKS